KGKRKPNLGGRGAGRVNTCDKTQNLSLKDIVEAKGPVSIHFDVGDKQTLNPLGPHAAHWSNYIGEVVRSVPLYYPSWEKVPKERKAAIISEIGTLFDLRPHMDSSRWTEIYEGINMHLQKAYNTNKASFKAKHWKADPTTGTYDVEAIRRARPEEITAAEWDKYIKFWNDPKNLARAAQNRLNRQKSVVTSRQGSRSLARLRDEMRQASDTQEYPSLIDTFWRTHTVDGVFPKDEDRRIYEEMKRLEATGEYTEDEINALARGGKLRGHIPGVGRVLPSRATSRPSMSAPVDKSLKSMHRKVDFMMSLFRSDNKYADMFKEFESGGASGSGGCGDDEESGDDEDDDGESCGESIQVCHRGTNCLTEKRVGPTSSLGIIAGDCIPDEYSPATIPQRHVAGDRFPQRHVAGENPEMLLGKTPIVVVFVVLILPFLGVLGFSPDEERTSEDAIESPYMGTIRSKGITQLLLLGALDIIQVCALLEAPKWTGAARNDTGTNIHGGARIVFLRALRLLENKGKLAIFKGTSASHTFFAIHCEIRRVHEKLWELQVESGEAMAISKDSLHLIDLL
ncbi:F-box domain containing protein, partial [Tanacetum coccineum]